MSAFIVSKKHIDALLTAGLECRPSDKLRWYWPSLDECEAEGTHQRGEPWGPGAVDAANQRRRELDRKTAGRVGAMLWAENERSVNHRYDEEEIEEPYVYERYAGPLTPVMVLKAISCYEYQTCEHPEWRRSEAWAFCEALRHRMINRLPGYEEAPWGI